MGSLTNTRHLSLALLCLILAGCSFEAVKPPPGYTGEPCVFSCESVGKNCGEISNSCGGTTWCGDCASGDACGSAGRDNVCCTPTTCEEQSVECGQFSDGCGRVLECGTCPDGENCGGGGANICGVDSCDPTNCATLGFDCGTTSDECGGVLACGACSAGETCGGGGGQPNVCAEDEVIVPPDDIVTDCFGWPAQEFTPLNFAPTRASLPPGSEAIDFELRDLEGASHRLSDLLATKPVLLQTGSYTCPAYQQEIEATEGFAMRYGDALHVVVIYTIEAHPKEDPSPYRGTVWESRVTENYRQPRTYDERLIPARALDLSSRQLLLIDELGTRNNPGWCTYGPAPNAAYLIATDGTIVAAQTWFDPMSMRDEITALLP